MAGRGPEHGQVLRSSGEEGPPERELMKREGNGPSRPTSGLDKGWERTRARAWWGLRMGSAGSFL